VACGAAGMGIISYLEASEVRFRAAHRNTISITGPYGM